MIADDIEKQLLILKDLTRNSGILHEGQILQLSNWAMIAIDQAKEAPEIRFGYEQKMVDFIFKKLPKKHSKDFTKKAEILAQNVQWLLGDDFTIRIKNGNKLLFRYAPKGE